MQLPCRQLGLTLIECLVCVAILSMLVGLGMPRLTHLIRNAESISAANRIVRAVNVTRHAAASFGQTTTLCPYADGVDCGGPWAGPLVHFVDAGRDGRISGRDHILQVIQPLTAGGSVKWRSFRNRQFLQFTSEGFTNYQNGNFVYCNASEDPRYSRQIVINVQGRARVMNVCNAAGLRIDRKGKLLRC